MDNLIHFACKMPPYYHQMTLEDLLFGTDTQKFVANYNETNTRTYVRRFASHKYIEKYDYTAFTIAVKKLEEEYADVYEAEDLSVFYNTFYIPKKSHGMRRIDAPQGRLKEAQYKLRDILASAMEKDVYGNSFGATYHTAAFAYIKGRSTKDAIKRHQSNKSRWFAKFDFSNFFGSTTPEFLIQQFGMIAPFCFFRDRNFVSKMLRIAFLDGGLPQGTPLSPMLTNIMMIPIDFKLQNTLREFNNSSYIYTRYADDILVSSRYSFKFRDIEELINKTLEEFDAPFRIKQEKTRYGSSSGSNWNLGMMLNRDNEITIGYRAKRQFKAALTNYAMDRRNGNRWDLGEVQHLNGLYSHYKNIEGDPIDDIIKKLSEKFGIDIKAAIKADLKGQVGA